jgi:hypothetical protein
MKFRHPVILVVLVIVFGYGCMSVSSDCPVLVLATDSNFGTYTGEILRAEGFNEFMIDSITDKKMNLACLKRYDVVILSETDITESQKWMLSDYVKAGGNLIAFKPDKQLEEIFGITHADSIIKDGYLKIDVFGDIGKSLVSESIQFHGISDTYRLNGAEKIASLCKSAHDSTLFPALVINSYGTGHTAAFTYNLPKSIVYTRQGNPDWAGAERDNVDGPTATDLFYPESGEEQWNDPSRIAIPQADEQMRLLSHIIEKFAGYKKPIPRFWYFPDDYKCIFIFTIDGEDSHETDIDNEIADIQSKGGNVTLYEIGTYIKGSTVSKWRSNGNEVAIHYNDVPNYADPTYSNMNTVFDTMTANFQNAYGISPKPARNDWVVWCSKDSSGKNQFVEQAIIEEKYGVGMDCNYYQFGGNKVYPNWIGDVGHFTGSGIPMKFAASSGRIIDVYQSNTQLPDETWLKENIENKSKMIIARSLDEENYAYINANYHTWYWSECREAGLRVLDYCNSRGVPVWPAERVYEFLKMKDESCFTNISWSHKILTFRIQSSIINPEGLTFLLPAVYGDLKIRSVDDNGRALEFKTRMVKGYEYAMATVKPGVMHKISVRYRSNL